MYECKILVYIALLGSVFLFVWEANKLTTLRQTGQTKCKKKKMYIWGAGWRNNLSDLFSSVITPRLGRTLALCSRWKADEERDEMWQCDSCSVCVTEMIRRKMNGWEAMGERGLCKGEMKRQKCWPWPFANRFLLNSSPVLSEKKRDNDYDVLSVRVCVRVCGETCPIF